VEYAQPSYRLQRKFTPNDPFYRDGSQWNLSLVHLERAWDIQPAAGSNITVAVLDTGVSYANMTANAHAYAFRNDQGVLYPALGDLTLNFVLAPELAPGTRFVAPYDFIWNDAVPLDLDGHGTHVSGTIGQLTNNGIAVSAGQTITLADITGGLLVFAPAADANGAGYAGPLHAPLEMTDPTKGIENSFAFGTDPCRLLALEHLQSLASRIRYTEPARMLKPPCQISSTGITPDSSHG
jgi:subtilisin family serine protease